MPDLKPGDNPVLSPSMHGNDGDGRHGEKPNDV
jgi:hypothetical protein